MKRFIVLLSLLYSLNSFALVLVEPGFGIGLGMSDLSQNIGSEKYDHDGYVASAYASGKLGLSLLNIHFGADYSYAKSAINSRRDNQTGTVTDTRAYDIVMKQKLFGIFAGYYFSSINLRFWGSYYTKAKGTISHAEEKDANIFEKGDVLEGHGYGVGFSAKKLGYLGINAEMRRIIYDKMTLSGTVHNLPNDSFPSEYEVVEVYVGLSLMLDLF